MKLPLLTAFLFFTVACFSQNDTTVERIIPVKIGTIYQLGTREDDPPTFVKDNYKITYPIGWRVDTSKLRGSEFYLFAQAENAADKFLENVSLLIQNMKGKEMDLKKYQQLTEKEITDSGSHTYMQIVESDIIKDKNKAYYKLVFNAQQPASLKLRGISYTFIKNDLCYMLTFATEFDKAQQFEPLGEQILNSFTFTK